MSTTERKHVTIYTDGACTGNPGPGGYAAVLLYGEQRKELSQGYRLTTNNRMEMLAAIAGLEALKYPCDVTIYSDSQLLVDAVMKGWMVKWKSHGWKRKKKPLLNADLWQKLWACFDQHTVEFIWVKGHAGNPENERADTLATMATAQDNLLIDEVYESGSTSVEEPQSMSLFDLDSTETS